MLRLRRFAIKSVLTMLTMGALSGIAAADSVFDLNSFINGDLPLGTVSAVFHQNVSGTITLSLESHLTSASEFISGIGFNVNPSFTDFANLTIGGCVAGTGSCADTITKATDSSFNPTSIGKFDIVFDWAGSNHGFGGSDIVQYTLSYSGSQSSLFNENLFNAVSTPGPSGKGPYYAAVKIQGIPPDGSGELADTNGPGTSAVPEPASLALIGSGLVLVTRKLRKNRKA